MLADKTGRRTHGQVGSALRASRHLQWWGGVNFRQRRKLTPTVGTKFVLGFCWSLGIAERAAKKSHTYT